MFQRSCRKKLKKSLQGITMSRFFLWFRKVVEMMAVVYATLIIKGKKTFADVPAKLKDEVKQILIDLDCADLAQ